VIYVSNITYNSPLAIITAQALKTDILTGIHTITVQLPIELPTTLHNPLC